MDDSDIRGIIRKIPRNERVNVSRTQIQQIAEDEDAVPEPAPTDEEYIALLALLIWAASRGIADAKTKNTGEEEERAKRDAIENITQRLNVILYGREAYTDAPPPPHIENPNLPNGGGINSAFWVALYLYMAIQALKSEDKELTEPAIIEEYERVRASTGESGETRNEERASLIGWEMARAVAVGLYFMALARGATTKTWLETKSANPRQAHLDQVGVTIPFNAYFPDGSFWSNEIINCKCGIRLGYK